MPEKEVSAVFAMRSSPLMAAAIETNNEKSNITVLTAAVQGAQFERHQAQGGPDLYRASAASCR
jgi:hypothetical protein